MSNQVVPAAKAVIVKNNKILAIETEADQDKRWDLPGGKIEYGETPKEALKREVDEEVSLNVEIESVIGTYSFQWKDLQIVPIVFKCKLLGKEEIHLGENPNGEESVINYRWMELSNFKSSIFFDRLGDIIEDELGR
jgi:8-oxo-dGTP diphosphatase